ncbi:MAG: hypothetical protein DCE90_15510 [Pseudanabaena sp.]|nr:MAG: hypothetical protein DCE90_15510 [Pseudanabaena sp.]
MKLIKSAIYYVLLVVTLSTSLVKPVNAQENIKGLVTGLTDELVGDNTCQNTGGILAYAETKDYALYICGDIKDASRPRHYRSVNKNGTPGVTLTARTYNPDQGNYFEFYNGDYVYLLQIPSKTIQNPVLMVEFPDGSGYEQKISRFLLSNFLLQRESILPISTVNEDIAK